jgi:hypothetical protein
LSVSADQDKVIWVFDPGMMEAGGHHAALAETLCQAKTRQKGASIRVFAHQLLDEQLRKRLAESGISTELSFTGMFYKYFHDGAELGPAGLQKYIRVLALEYKQLLEQAVQYSRQHAVVIFLPCLNWEHATALSYAINQTQLGLSQSNMKLVACAMYSPNSNDQGSSIKSVWYKMAFEALAKYSFVSLYCSEQELSNAYTDLLPVQEWKVHPCYLMDWSGIRSQSDSETTSSASTKRYLLYMGDAKVDKGFNLLPEVLQKGLAASGADVEFVIQFTLAWEYPEIMATVDSLKKWALTEPRLKLHHGFWSNQDMVKMLRQIDGAICTYDVNEYQHKSSGLIWILAFFNIPLVIAGKCWLSREAERLDVVLTVDESLAINCFTKLKTVTAPISSSYHNALFAPLLAWLLSHSS